MQRPIATTEAPAPAGPFSQIVAFRDLVFISGQGAMEPETGRVASRAIEDQVDQALRNVDALLRAAGTGRERVLMVRVYLTDLAHLETMNRRYREFFGGAVLPARTTIEAAALPGDSDVEIDVVAWRDD